MIVNVRYCVIGEDVRLEEDAHIEISDGVVAHVGRGKISGNARLDFETGVAIPALINAHIHPFDHAFMEAGLGLTIGELVREPDGLKHRLLREASDVELERAVTQVASFHVSQGALTMAGFYELGLRGAIVASSGSRGLPLRNIILSRPYRGVDLNAELDELLSFSDGLGLSSPLVYDVGSLRLMREKSFEKLVAVHVAETRSTYEKGDFELAIEHLRPDLIVHGVHLTKEEVLAIVERGVSIVSCPRANMWFSTGLPPLDYFLECEANVALGTDNAGWVSPDLWREMECAWNILRLKGKLNICGKDVLKMATVNAAKALKLDELGMIEEGKEASIVILDSNSLGFGSSHDKLASLVKRGCAKAVLAAFFRGSLIK